ncbi:interleukin-22 receptor subunit alpha-1 [Talpa occidentalis]|uniref:interleukin-22 receptor subunit alpha-1 n=1 Tax=Talpa occidentalis TaxID=50954 RepID=UPI00188FCC77|nr:interleukin-22 receptor subunit alpha-1 [Talpa occidentalis]
MKMLLTILVTASLAAHIPENTSDILQHVKFQSSNFENILTWDSGPQTAPDTVYSVEYKMYGEKAWLPKEGCQRITRKSCNLTMETANYNESYYARVTATSTRGQSVTQMTERFCSQYVTTIKPPEVTCIPKVRSIQMIVHPSPTPIQAGDGHWLTLEDIFQELYYRLKLQDNHTFQVHLEGKQREFEFSGLTPDTEFLGTTTIWLPNWSKESRPYVCRVKTLPDQTWTYSFSGAALFLMGLLVAGLCCCLSYRYVTKPSLPPNSLNIPRVLTFQPLQLIQKEHVLIPIFEISRPSSVAQTVQYSQVMVSQPKEPQGAPSPHSQPGITYLGQPDIARQSSRAPPPQTLPSLSYAPQVAAEVKLPSYAPQVTPEAKPLFYTPQAISEVQPHSYTPQATQDSWLPSYGICMEGAGKDSPPMTLSSPKHLKPKGQLQKEALDGNSVPGGFSLQGVTSLATGEPQETKCFHQHLGIHTDPNVPQRGDPGTPGYLKAQLPLLSSVQIEGHPVSLPVHMPSIPRSPTDQGPSPWGMLESLVCPEDEGPVSETEATNPATQAADLEQPTELHSLFRGLTVQWES